jgi:hypothetical protein
VSDRDFVFALDVSGDPGDDQMVTELARAVLRHVGYAASEIDALAAQLHNALAVHGSDGHRRCEVLFRAESGQFEIVVSGAAAADWRTTRPLPAS